MNIEKMRLLNLELVVEKDINQNHHRLQNQQHQLYSFQKKVEVIQ